VAQIPAIRLTGNARDDRGRAGVEVTLTVDGARSELIFDPRTSMLLEQRTVLVRAQQIAGAIDQRTADRAPGATILAGTTIDATVYLASGATNSTSTTP
jgi:hypothetical protein